MNPGAHRERKVERQRELRQFLARRCRYSRPELSASLADLVVVGAAQVMVVLDMTVVNIAMP